MDWTISDGASYFSLLRNVHTGSGAHRNSCSMDIGVHPRGYSGRGVKLATHFQIVLILILHGVIPLLLLCAYVCCNSRVQTGLCPFPVSCMHEVHNVI